MTALECGPQLWGAVEDESRKIIKNQISEHLACANEYRY